MLRSEKNAEAAQQTATSVDCQRQKVVREEVWASLRTAKMGQPLAEKEKHHGSAQNEVWSRGEFSSPVVLQRAGVYVPLPRLRWPPFNSLGNCHDNTWQVAISREKALFEEWVRGAIARWRQRRAPDFLKGAYQERDGRRFLLVDDVERRHLHKFAQLSIATLRGIPLPIIDPSLPENSFKQFHIINGLPVRIRDSQFLLASCHEGMFL